MPPHAPGATVFGGIYVFFGWVGDGKWGPSNRNSNNNDGVFGYSYLYPGEGGSADTRREGEEGDNTQLLVSFTAGGESGTSTANHMDDNGDWTATLKILGPTFQTQLNDGTTKTTDCRQVQCGVFSIGAHGKSSATNEKFAPVTFGAGNSTSTTATTTPGGSGATTTTTRAAGVTTAASTGGSGGNTAAGTGASGGSATGSTATTTPAAGNTATTAGSNATAGNTSSAAASSSRTTSSGSTGTGVSARSSSAAASSRSSAGGTSSAALPSAASDPLASTGPSPRLWLIGLAGLGAVVIGDVVRRRACLSRPQ